MLVTEQESDRVFASETYAVSPPREVVFDDVDTFGVIRFGCHVDFVRLGPAHQIEDHVLGEPWVLVLVGSGVERCEALLLR